MAAAIRTILLADLVMSLDNVLALAAAAHGDTGLLITGLVLSIPLVGFGSTLLMQMMERWPWIIQGGGALLGWVAGEMAVSDPSLAGWFDLYAGWAHLALPIAGAAFILASGRVMDRRFFSQP
jgi:predicted tellurium resistance membrane protein TerC